jgi:ubiquinone/menaquinone biosynthesis C-methylase UbiE
MNSQQAEISRIQTAYKLRLETVPRDRYSFFLGDNLLLHLELLQSIQLLLRRSRHTKLEQTRILDVGCGRGFWLRHFIQWGANPKNLFGIDLLPERIAQGKELCPTDITLELGDASELRFAAESFDLVLQFTVFTSILDFDMKRRIAGEMTRVLKRGGAVLWYDYFRSNPQNADVRGVTAREIHSLFPDLKIFLKRITLAPPLGRIVAPFSPSLYRFLSTLAPLRTHYIGLLQKL